MTQTLMDTMEVELTPRKMGLLDAALSVPQGWAQGLAIPFYGCGEPLLQDRCATANDVAYGPGVAEFHPFGVSQGAVCSTLGRMDQKAHASGRLNATTEWAVARQLATDVLGLGSPSFADGTSLGTVTDGDFVLAVATLEQAAADAGFGTEWWLHGPIKAAAYLADQDQMDSDFVSPTGAKWVISPGYPVQGTTTIRLWATGPVFAAVAEPYVLNDVDRGTNHDEAYANREAIVAFDPCINLYIDVTVPASPTP